MKKKSRPTSLWNKYFFILIGISLITSMGFSMLYTIISAYAVEIGSTISIAGVVAGIFSISALIVRPFSGLMSDRFNKKKVFAFAVFIISIASFGYALSPNIPLLLFFRILHGAAFGISSTANISLVSEFIPRKRLAEGLGYFGVGKVLSRVIGPTIGVSISKLFSFNILFLIIALLNIIAVFLLWKLPYKQESDVIKEDQDHNISIDSLIAKKVLVYAAVGGIFSLGNGIVNSFLVLVGDKRGIGGISIFFAINAIVLFIVRLFVGRQADKRDLSSIVNISLLCLAISMVVLGLANSLNIILIAAIFKAIGQGGGQISLQAKCLRKVDESRTGVAASTFYFGADIGQGIGPMIGGAISSAFNYKMMFFFVTVLIGITFIIFNIYQKKQKRGSSSSGLV